jgi:beta-1,4-mannosyl-glycoprotein beta-1,4-N-acetylglucosaminyltransferase
MKIIDCFTFYNEVDLLKFRLNILKDIVDTFVIVEANQTHMGKDKQLFSKDLSSLFSDLSGQIIHAIIDLPHRAETLNTGANHQWVNEKFQRNHISQIIKSLELHDDDVILISDVDEIPDPTMISKVREGLISVSVNKLEQDFYYYNLRSKFINKWYHAKIIRHSVFEQLRMTCSDIRHRECNSIPRGGWHLSYFGNKEFIRNKLENFAHSEHNIPQTTDLTNIQRCIDKTECLVGKSFKMYSIPLSENKYLPPEYTSYLKMFL